MTTEAEVKEPMLCPGPAKTLLLMTDRATEVDGELFLTDESPDSIAKGAFLVYRTGRPSILSKAIEEARAAEEEAAKAAAGEAVPQGADGRWSALNPALLGEMVSHALVEHAHRFDLPAAQVMPQTSV